MRSWGPSPALHLGWLWLLFLLGAFVVLVGEDGDDQAKAYFSGTPGKVAPFRDCVWAKEGKAHGWACRGVFTGGGLRVNDVRIRPLLDELPTGQVPAVISGPDATTAWTDDDWRLLLPAAGSLLMVLIPAGMTFAVYREDLVDPIKNWWRRRRVRGELDDVQDGLGDLRRDLAALQRDIDDLQRKLNAGPPADQDGGAGPGVNSS
ncbi:hypothetical protein [Actinoplanes regularis]|uniref:hypothetical protein n=1 Tax=Actinoplanes regularis TaxID=52697 RepID=UPI0024A3B67E|nr:hypothetical protein [Actinoplanes regularis]GLW34974.1 hypothetical protein Areg01_79100 [Actinoplanes regularis]